MLSSIRLRSGIGCAPKVALLVVPLALAAQGESPLRLEQQWRASLGSSYSEAIFRLAVCPDGSSYFADSKGRIARLDAAGQATLDSAGHEELRATMAIACDGQGRLRAASPGYLTAWETRGALLRGVSSIDIRSLRLVLSRLVITPQGEFYILGRRLVTGSGEFIHRLDSQGRLLRLFGAPPAGLEASLAR